MALEPSTLKQAQATYTGHRVRKLFVDADHPRGERFFEGVVTRVWRGKGGVSYFIE